MVFFSIIIPCFNQANWLKQSVQSLLIQDFTDWEIIIVNDGSTDDSGEVADAFAKQHKKIKVIHQENAGLSAARNTGLAAASGDWLNFLDSDDYLLEGCLSSVAKSIHELPAYKLVQTGYIMVDENNELISTRSLSGVNGDFSDIVFNGNIGPPLSVFIENRLSKQIGVFDTALKSAEDWDYWVRAAKAGAKRQIISTPLVAYRHTAGSMSRNAWRMYENTLMVIQRIPHKDNRLNISSVHNKETAIDTHAAIKLRLLQCLGLALMQGRIDESLVTFKTESFKYKLTYLADDFGNMNSFMSFKNWYRKPDVKRVLKEYPRYFSVFFSETTFSEAFKNAAMNSVFEYHTKNNNIYQYGIAGKLLNKIATYKKGLYKPTVEKGY